MEKSVHVLDKCKNVIGATYIKRANQLVKKCRAKWISDNAIMIVKEDLLDMQQYQSPPCAFEKHVEPESPTTAHRSFNLKSYLLDSSHLIFELIGLFVFGMVWYLFCSVLGQFMLSTSMAVTLFALPVCVGLLVVLLKVFLRVKNFLISKLHDDLALCEMSELDDAHLEAFIKKNMIEKRALKLHFALYLVVNTALIIFLAFLSSSFYIDLTLLWMFSVCIWGIVVVMHYIIFSTKVTPMKINKELQRAKRKVHGREPRSYS